MSSTVTDLVTNQHYNISFWYAVRGSGYNHTTDRLTLFVGDANIWHTAADLSDAGGWFFASKVFSATATSETVVFNLVSTADQDHAVLVDSVVIAKKSPPTGSLLIGKLYGFETPVLNGSAYGAGLTLQPYSYNPLILITQPWTWTWELGGIALIGSPWDPPAPSQPPGGAQYGYIQTSPNGALGDQTSTMWSTLTGMTSGSSYKLSFYIATRGSGYNATQSTLTVTVGTHTVYTSNRNLHDAAGWKKQNAAQFTATAASATISFSVVSSSNQDHAVLIDNVKVVKV
jgi:hypothetical protein